MEPPTPDFFPSGTLKVDKKDRENNEATLRQFGLTY
jgi:hypothetical protein